MTRALQDRLALANVKLSQSWDTLSTGSTDPEREKELKRKRADIYADVFSDTSSSVSGRCFTNGGIPASSPLTGPVFSDEVFDHHDAQLRIASKRYKAAQTMAIKRPQDGGVQSRTRYRSTRAPATASWKSLHHLPESSPSFRHNFRLSTSNVHLNSSFASNASTIPEPSPSVSEDDDQDIPIHSFQVSENHIASSPPRTPSPRFARARLNGSTKDFTPSLDDSNAKMPGREGADLLLYLASSPSPAFRSNKTPMLPPSTPPAKHGTPLPSAMMGTPGGSNMHFGLPNTPGTSTFNFHEYLNVTPSPAQAPWPKTPGTLRTPRAKKSSHFDSLMPPPFVGGTNDSPRRSSARRGLHDPLGLELGGELLS